MTSANRDAAVLAEVTRRDGVVPSCQQMARALNVSPMTVSRAYRRLALKASPRAPRMPVTAQLDQATYNRLYVFATARRISLSAGLSHLARVTLSPTT